MKKPNTNQNNQKTPHQIIVYTPAEQRSSGQVAAMRMATFVNVAKHPGWILKQQLHLSAE